MGAPKKMECWQQQATSDTFFGWMFASYVNDSKIKKPSTL
ncbi:hypothetical protein SLEP1_g32487 [Rubroshorea leprosula]|uniref:Uncharacterized protein n=1 Tax=Rubroshorea leprosula TaxID=152421 RepID=A0AAV5KDK0_9ROSI|nr:hypothetical protein SLEP1_g32487 [Rubroshorea leprosula]